MSSRSNPLKRFFERRANSAKKKQARRAIFEAQKTPADRFTAIYETNYWHDGESVSGPGSSLAYTANLRQAFPSLVEKLAVKKMIDAPCGDFNWMQHVLPAIDVDYIGGDIVAPLIAQNKERYGTARIQFQPFDITSDAFAKADLWMCRDCLFHLSYDDIFAALENFCRADIPYLFTSTHLVAAGYQNRDIETGDFREIDLFAAPFNFPREVVARIDDSPQQGLGREMCVWTRDQVLAVLAAHKNSNG